MLVDRTRLLQSCQSRNRRQIRQQCKKVLKLRQRPRSMQMSDRSQRKVIASLSLLSKQRLLQLRRIRQLQSKSQQSKKKSLELENQSWFNHWSLSLYKQMSQLQLKSQTSPCRFHQQIQHKPSSQLEGNNLLQVQNKQKLRLKVSLNKSQHLLGRNQLSLLQKIRLRQCKKRRKSSIGVTQQLSRLSQRKKF